MELDLFNVLFGLYLVAAAVVVLMPVVMLPTISLLGQHIELAEADGVLDGARSGAFRRLRRNLHGDYLIGLGILVAVSGADLALIEERSSDLNMMVLAFNGVVAAGWTLFTRKDYKRLERSFDDLVGQEWLGRVQGSLQ